MSGYPGNYGPPPTSYPPVTGHAPGANYQQGYAPPPPQGYPQQYAPPQQYPPQPAYAPAPYAPAPYAPTTYASPYPPATGWAPTSYAAPLSYTAPMGAYAAPVAYAAPMAVAAPVMAAPVMMGMPAMNYNMQFRGAHLDRKDIFSKSDPFLVLWASKHPGGYHAAHNISKRERHSTKHNKKFGGMSGNWVMIYRSETLHNNQNPMWAPFMINLISLCGGNFDTVFKVEVWDSDVHSNHDFIGSAITTMRELQTSKEVRLVNKRRIGIHNSSGRLEVVRCAPA